MNSDPEFAEFLSDAQSQKNQHKDKFQRRRDNRQKSAFVVSEIAAFVEIGHKERAENAQVEMVEQNRNDGVGGKCDQNRNHRRGRLVSQGKNPPHGK